MIYQPGFLWIDRFQLDAHFLSLNLLLIIAQSTFMLQQRPRIQPVLSKADKIVEISGLILIIAIWCFTLFAYMRLPEIIPIHFNARGKADDVGHKGTFLILPVIVTILYWGLKKLNKYPHIFNYMVTITEENAAHQYTVSTRMIRYLMLTLLLVFSGIMVFIYLGAIGKADGMSQWFLPAALGFLLLPVLYAILQRKDKSKSHGLKPVE